MTSDIKVDRLSGLPDSIINSILIRLPLKKAVHTSILSSSWRYKWHFLSKIIIPYCNGNIVNVVDHILLVHCGSVDKFELDDMPEACDAIERWILYLSRNGVKELKIINYGRFYNFPSCVYSCSCLTHLHLQNCIFKPPPAAFKAFSNLTELLFGFITTTDKVLENLVHSCPLLSKLLLWEVQLSRDLSRLTLPEDKNCTSLNINAPNLLVLEFLQSHFDFQLQLNTPLLATFSLELCQTSHIEGKRYHKLDELLGSMPVLQTLKFRYGALRYFDVGDIPLRHPSIFPIKHLQVTFNSESLQECLAVFCIFRSSPFMEHLDIEIVPGLTLAMISAEGFWEGEYDFSFKFHHLQQAVVHLYAGSENGLKFVEFLLASAPVLKTMKLHFYPNDEDEEDDEGEGEGDGDDEDEDLLPDVVEKLIRLPRISPEAEFIYIP